MLCRLVQVQVLSLLGLAMMLGFGQLREVIKEEEPPVYVYPMVLLQLVEEIFIMVILKKINFLFVAYGVRERLM